MEPVNLHATALVAGSAGLLIRGRSGSGKSRLALALIDQCHLRGRFAALIADDRVWLSAHGDRLVATAPEPIAGLIEIRGYGPAPLAHEKHAVIDRLVTLVDPQAAPRHRQDATGTLAGLPLPCLDLAARDAEGGARAVLAWLDL